MNWEGGEEKNVTRLKKKNEKWIQIKCIQCVGSNALMKNSEGPIFLKINKKKQQQQKRFGIDAIPNVPVSAVWNAWWNLLKISRIINQRIVGLSRTQQS